MMAGEGLFLVNAHYILLYMTATNERGGYIQDRERRVSLLHAYIGVKLKWNELQCKAAP
jgi:hypothetical protein